MVLGIFFRSKCGDEKVENTQSGRALTSNICCKHSFGLPVERMAIEDKFVTVHLGVRA